MALHKDIENLGTQINELRRQVEENQRHMGAMRAAFKEKMARLDGILYELHQKVQLLDKLRRDVELLIAWRRSLVAAMSQQTISAGARFSDGESSKNDG